MSTIKQIIIPADPGMPPQMPATEEQVYEFNTETNELLLDGESLGKIPVGKLYETIYPEGGLVNIPDAVVIASQGIYAHGFTSAFTELVTERRYDLDTEGAVNALVALAEKYAGKEEEFFKNHRNVLIRLMQSNKII